MSANHREIAELIIAELKSLGYQWEQRPFIADIERVVAKLNLTVAPPKVEGSVRVQFAVGYGPGSDGGAVVQASGVDDFDDIEHAKQDAFFHDDTHRAIVEAWIPPIAPVPAVEGTVANG